MSCQVMYQHQQPFSSNEHSPRSHSRAATGLFHYPSGGYSFVGPYQAAAEELSSRNSQSVQEVAAAAGATNEKQTKSTFGHRYHHHNHQHPSPVTSSPPSTAGSSSPLQHSSPLGGGGGGGGMEGGGGTYLSAAVSTASEASSPAAAATAYAGCTPGSQSILQRLAATMEPSCDRREQQQHSSSTTPPPVATGDGGEHHQQHHHHHHHHGSSGRAAKSSRQNCKSESSDEATSAQYLTANCVLVTYFTGDISQVVDEHFTRALNGGDGTSSHSPDKSNETLPLSQRNLPPSFWNSDFQYPPPPPPPPSAALSSLGHAALAAGHDLYSDPYSNPALFQNDPWQNYMAAAGSYSAHRAAHDMYSARLNPQYQSLFLQSTARQGSRAAAAAGFGKGADGWGGGGGGGHSIDGYGVSHPHYSAMTGLDGSMQSTSKDLYWF